MLEIFSKSHTNKGGRSWCLDHRSRGDAPVTCLAIIVGTIVLGVWAYYHFWHNRALERAGQDITIAKKVETSAVNAYRFRVRDRLMPATQRVNTNCRKACKAVYKDKNIDVDEVQSDLLKCEEEMRELIDDINGIIVPRKYESMHKNMAVSVGCNWQALCKARKALKKSDPTEKKQLIEESKKDLSKGNRACEAAGMAAATLFK